MHRFYVLAAGAAPAAPAGAAKAAKLPSMLLSMPVLIQHTKLAEQQRSEHCRPPRESVTLNEWTPLDPAPRICYMWVLGFRYDGPSVSSSNVEVSDIHLVAAALFSIVLYAF